MKGKKNYLWIRLKFIVPSFKGSLGEHLQVSENNSSHTFVELLRRRDGLPGRDGIKGRPGPPGPQGIWT